MIRIPALRIALAAIAMLLVAGKSQAEQPAAETTSGLKVTVEVVDGSRVIGEPVAEELKIAASVGEMSVPLENVGKVVFNDDHKTAVVSLLNGDHLSGAIKSGTFSLQTIWGKVDLKPQQIRTITVTGRANSWSVKSDFATTSNPNGSWFYGWVAQDGGKFALYKSQVGDGWRAEAEEPTVWINRTGQAECCVQPGEVSEHAGANGEHAIVRWQAPKSCRVHVKGTFGAGDIGAVDVKVLHNTTVLFKADETKKDEPFEFDVAVKAGDTLDFDVGAGKEGYAYGNKPIDAVISVK
ncbi:MAG TPA: hypothetical protein VG733_05925 [Chthoniobacteraceae bacterium]|nr:hypothetical protein [Chthoniobacteraceae bacterium]